MSDANEKDRKPFGGWRYVGHVELPPDTIITDGGWVVPRPATREDVHAAVQQGTAEVRREVGQLRAEVLAGMTTKAVESSPAHVVVGQGVARPAMLDTKACAALLGVSIRSWQRLVEQGEAPAPVKLGRLTRWRLSDVEAYVAARR